jgi:hypothetical protein
MQVLERERENGSWRGGKVGEEIRSKDLDQLHRTFLFSLKHMRLEVTINA